MDIEEELNKEELLRYAIDNGIIKIDDILKKKNMRNKEAILKKHPYEIWRTNDGRYGTYLPDIKSKRGKVQRIRKTEEELKDVIVEFYRDNDVDVKELPEKKRTFTKYSFKKLFESLLQYKKEIVGVTDNTISKYESDYRRFFKDSTIEDQDIRHLDEEDVQRFIIERIRTLKLTVRNTKDMIAYMRATFERAKKELEDNPFQYIKLEIFKKHFHEAEVKTSAQRTVSDIQMEQLNDRFAYYHEKMPRYIPIYAVELASLTGFRVGELAALRWDRIYDDHIHIDLSEKYNRVKKEYYITSTKNGKERDYPLTPEIQVLLKRVYDVEKKYGYLSEYVFSNENGRIHARTISESARSASIYMGMESKSIHTYRRTISSKLKCGGVPTVVVASLMGHTEEVNEHNYTYDVTDKKYKKEIIENITKNLKKNA